jgi:hypothetical protein
MREFLTVLTLVVLLAGGCATGPGAIRDEDSILRERAEAFWAAKAKGDWKTAETYVDPDIRPDLEPYLKGLKEGPHYAEFKSVEIIEVKIRGEEADVGIKYSVKWTHPLLAGMPVQDRQTKEAWRQNKGVWYLVMERPDPGKVFQRLGPKEGGR